MNNEHDRWVVEQEKLSLLKEIEILGYLILIVEVLKLIK